MNKVDQLKMKELEWSQDFPQANGSYLLPWRPEFWSNLAQNLMQPIPYPNDASDKIDYAQPAGLRDIHVWKCGRTDARTDGRTYAGWSPILKAHAELSALVS